MIKRKFILFLIVLFALGSYLYKLTDYPSGFYQNEAAFGYNSYSLLKTGRDEYGRFLPLVLESFGDYKLSAYSYYIIPFICIFGLTEIAVRLSAVFSGLIILILTYKIIKAGTDCVKLALLSTLLLSASPWLIVFSRTANETVFAVSIFLSSVYLFMIWREKYNLNTFFAGTVMLVLSVGSYYSVWLPALILIGFVVVAVFKKYFLSVRTILYLVFCLTSIALMLWATILTGTGRLKQINIFHNQGLNLLLDEQIREDQRNLSEWLLRVIHNKLTYYPNAILGNMSDNLNLRFFFISGDAEEKVYMVPNSGILLPILLPLILCGVLFFWSKFSWRSNLVILSLILSGILGTALAIHGSVSQRLLVVAPFVLLIGGAGSLFIYENLARSKIRFPVIMAMVALFIYELSIFNHQYFYHATVHQPWFRNFGAKEMVKYVEELSPRYKKVYISGNPYIFFNFFDKVDPLISQSDAKYLQNYEDALGHKLRVKSGKYDMLPIDCPAAGKTDILYVCRGNKIPRTAKILKVIYYLDDQPAYIFLNFSKDDQTSDRWKNIDYMKLSDVLTVSEDQDWYSEQELQI